MVKSLKIVITDTGLASHLTGSRRAADLSDLLKGPLFESFVLTELEKLRNWSDVRPSLFHYRTPNGREVDAVFEARDGSLVGIEIKASTRVSSRDFNGLKSLREAAGDSFLRGIILYNGEEQVSFTQGLTAVPIQALWQW